MLMRLPWSLVLLWLGKKYIVTRSFDLLVDFTCFQVGRENGFLLSFDRECT